MAWNFGAQINSLTQFDGNNTNASEEGENYSTLASQWLTDAAREVINLLPMNLLKLCTAEETFTSAAVGSESETLNTGKILSVFAGDYAAREIPSHFKHKANDPDSIEYATTTDPVYYFENNKINVLPSGISCKYEEVAYPSVSYNAVDISVFPDEAEYLVVLRAAITAAEYKLNFEEDPEIYVPIIQNLKQDYMTGLQAIGAVPAASPQAQAQAQGG